MVYRLIAENPHGMALVALFLAPAIHVSSTTLHGSVSSYLSQLQRTLRYEYACGYVQGNFLLEDEDTPVQLIFLFFYFFFIVFLQCRGYIN